MRGPVRDWSAFFICIALLVGCGGCGSGEGTRLVSVAGENVVRDGKVRITILHTNDTHGQILPQKATWIDAENPPAWGGMLALASYVRQVRAEVEATGGHLLLVDGGDIFQGTPEATLTRGDVVVDLMNDLDYDVAVVGNHEYDLGQENFERLVARSSFPWLGANIIVETTGEPASYVQPWIEKNLGGIRIGLIGLTSSDMKSLTGAGLTDGLRFEGESETLSRVLDGIDPDRFDLLALVTHIGHQRDQRLAGEFPRVPLILGGHSHRGFKNGWVHPETGVRYYQNWGKASTVSRIELVFSERTGKLLSVSGGLVDLPVATYGLDSKSLKIRNDFAEIRRIDREMEEVVGDLVTTLGRNRGFRSSALGNWITDCMRRETGAQIAFQNKTGIRADLAAGSIRRGALFEISPFGNTLFLMTLTGQQIRDLIENSLKKASRVLEISGLSLVVDMRRPVGARIVRAFVEGRPLDANASYRIVTSSFLSTGGDEHSIFLEGTDRIDTGTMLREATESFLRASSPLEVDFRERYRGLGSGDSDPVEEPPPPPVKPEETAGLGVALGLFAPGIDSLNRQAESVGQAYRARTDAAFESTEPFGNEERVDALRLLARRNEIGIVVAVGDGYGPALRVAAAEHGEVRFVHLDAGAGEGSSRVRSIVLARREAGFVLGALAAWLDGGEGTALVTGDGGPAASEIATGFTAGWAHAGGPRAPPILAVATDLSGYEGDRAARAAVAAIEGGQARRIAHFVGQGREALERAVAQVGGTTLGFGSEAAPAGPGVLARFEIRIGSALESVLQEASAGGGVQSTVGVGQGLIAIGYTDGEVDGAVRSRVEALIDAIRTGEVEVP